MKKFHPIRNLGAFLLGFGLIFVGSAFTLTSCDNGKTQDKTEEFKNKLAKFNQEIANPINLGTKEKRVQVNNVYTELLGYNVSDDLKTELKNSMLDFVTNEYEYLYATLLGKDYASFTVDHKFTDFADMSDQLHERTLIYIGSYNRKGLYTTIKSQKDEVGITAGEGSLTDFLDVSKILNAYKNQSYSVSYAEDDDKYFVSLSGNPSDTITTLIYHDGEKFKYVQITKTNVNDRTNDTSIINYFEENKESYEEFIKEFNNIKNNNE